MSDTPDHRIVFMGTPEFAVPSLEALVESGLAPVAVVTAPDRPAGRGQKIRESAVKQAAHRAGIDQILQPESVKDPAFAERVAELEPDVIVVVAFRILPPAVFETARLGAFNLHGSLLPAYRGAAPINRAVMAGETKTGVTTFFLREKVDTGNIILQKEMSIGPHESAGDVHDRMMVLGAEAVVETTRRILADEAQAMPQDDALATPAPKIFREDCRIDWQSSAADLHNFIRGLSPYPGAWTTHDGKQLKVFKARPVSAQLEVDGSSDSPGTVVSTDGHVYVATGDGVLELISVQLQGRTRMPVDEFLNGYSVSVGDRLT